MSEVLTEILARRKDRAIAIVLNMKEKEVDPLLPDDRRGREVSLKLRKVVLDQINDLHDLCADVLRSATAGGEVVLNEHYLQLIAELHEHVVGNGQNGHALVGS